MKKPANEKQWAGAKKQNQCGQFETCDEALKQFFQELHGILALKEGSEQPCVGGEKESGRWVGARFSRARVGGFFGAGAAGLRPSKVWQRGTDGKAGGELRVEVRTIGL
jgi:hypothetical protein